MSYIHIIINVIEYYKSHATHTTRTIIHFRRNLNTSRRRLNSINLFRKFILYFSLIYLKSIVQFRNS